MLVLWITPQAMSRIQCRRGMAAFVMVPLLLSLPASSSPSAAFFGSASKTKWIPCDRQLPAGSGFLVSENFPLEYPINLYCVYTIPLQTSTNSTSAICLRFQRFKMEETRDYLEIHGQPWMHNAYSKPQEFTGLGKKSPSSFGGFSNVWEDLFCWRPYEGKAYLKLVFHSDISKGDLGFYASYETVKMENIRDNNVQVATAEVGGGVVCFDRSRSDGEPCPSAGSGGCADRSDRSYAHSRCTITANVPAQEPGQLACDFNLSGGCGSLWTGGRMWERTSGSLDPEYGPSSGRKSYMVKDFSNSRGNWLGDITLGVPPSTTDKIHCLSFWYHMNGPDVGQLQINWHNPYRGKGALWRRKGSFGNYWHHTQLSLLVKGGRKDNNITFSARRGSSYRAQFAIDDLSLMEGRCPYYDDISCTFNDNHMCDWKWSGKSTDRDFNIDKKAVRNGALHYHCQPPSCQLNHNNVILTSPPVAVGGQICLILQYRLTGRQGKVVVSRSQQVIKEQWSVTDQDSGRRLGKYTISPPVGNESIAYTIQIGSSMESGGYFSLEEITFVPVSCEKISLGSCSNGDFRCRVSGRCISTRQLCDKKYDCSTGDYSDEANCHYKTGCLDGQFKCDNGYCISDDVVCNDYNDCGDNSDENNCSVSPTPPAGPSYSPVALIALIAGCILILCIILIKIGLCLHARHKRRRLLQLRERRLEALRNLGRCNSIDSLQPDTVPPSYASCIRDNPAFVLGEESEGNNKLPSYSEVIEGGFLMITHPVKAEVQRLRMEMQQERPAEEGTSTGEQEGGQSEATDEAAGAPAVTETSAASRSQEGEEQSVDQNHQRLSVDVENQEPSSQVHHRIPSTGSSDHGPPLDHAAEQDERLQQLHHRPSQEPSQPINISQNADGASTAPGIQSVPNGVLHQGQSVESENQHSPEVQTQPNSHYHFTDNVEEPSLSNQNLEEQGYIRQRIHMPAAEPTNTIIRDAPIYMLPHDSCPTHVSLAVWDDSEIHV